MSSLLLSPQDRRSLCLLLGSHTSPTIYDFVKFVPAKECWHVDSPRDCSCRPPDAPRSTASSLTTHRSDILHSAERCYAMLCYAALCGVACWTGGLVTARIRSCRGGDCLTEEWLINGCYSEWSGWECETVAPGGGQVPGVVAEEVLEVQQHLHFRVVRRKRGISVVRHACDTIRPNKKQIGMV